MDTATNVAPPGTHITPEELTVLALYASLTLTQRAAITYMMYALLPPADRFIAVPLSLESILYHGVALQEADRT
jgi:hypothetical protein